MALVTIPTESVFLTSLNKEKKSAQCRQQKREEMLDRMQGGDQILKLHGDLQSLADDLDEKVEAKLNANENAFMLAYKNFMYGVQKEFKELKQKADEEETKTRRDAKIQSLEKELDWFMHEALRLDELCKKHKKDLDKWKSRAEALEDDRQFLENSIKTAKKNNKILRGAVEKAQTSAYSALVAADDTLTKKSSPHVAPPPFEESVMTAHQSAASLGLSHELEGRYQSAVKKLKTQLDIEKRNAAKLRAMADRQFSEPSPLESFFEDCVERVKTDVKERRDKQAKRISKGREGREVVADESFIAPVMLDDFTVSDRKKVIEYLLSSEEVLHFLYGKIFPNK